MAKNDSKSYGSQKASIPHLSKPGSQIADLREDVDKGFIAAEARTGYPELDWLDGAGPLVAGGTVILKGRNLLQGKAFDTLSKGSGAAGIKFDCMTPGDSGISIAVVAGAGSLAVAFASNVLTITLASGGSLVSAVVTAVNASSSAVKGIIRAAATGAGTSNLVAFASTKMASGTGEYAGFYAKVAGVACKPLHADTSPVATWSDTQVSITVPALTGKAASDRVAIELVCDGVQTKGLVHDCGENAATSAAYIAADAVVSAAFAAADLAMQKRTDYPELDWLDGASIAAAGGAAKLMGRKLLGSKTFDSYEHGASTSMLTFTMMTPGGSSGYTVEIVQGTLGVALSTKKVTVSADLAGVDTADTIATEFNKSGGTMTGVMRCVSGGTGAVVALAETALANGVGTYGEEDIRVAGVECKPVHATGTTPAATWSDTQVQAQVPALTGKQATDVVAVAVKAGNKWTQQFSVVLV